jgi:hypothetical protein
VGEGEYELIDLEVEATEKMAAQLFGLQAQRSHTWGRFLPLSKNIHLIEGISI